MAYFEDLQPCTALPGEWRNLLAVGWLAKGHEYTRGPVAPELVELMDRAWSWLPPDAPSGTHECELCQSEDDRRAASGVFFVPGDGVLYVAPRLISHYVRKHGYQPPPVFLEALRASAAGVEREAVLKHRLDLESTALPAELPIRVLEGLQPVRARPERYLGVTGPAGLEVMLASVLTLFIKEHLCGSSTRLSVDLDERGWVTVADDGDGISVEPPMRLSPPWVELVFRYVSHVTSPPAVPHAALRVRHGPELFCMPATTTALSSRLEVETRWRGHAWRIAFASGNLVQPLTRGGETSERGAVVRYRPDDEIFDAAVRHELAAIERRLRAIALLCPRLDVRFNGKSLQAPEGLSTWLHEAAPELVKATLLSGGGTVDGIDVDFALGWRPRANAPLVRSFVNYGETLEGGSHVRGLTLAVENAIAAKRASRTKKALSGLVGIVHVGLEDPRLEHHFMLLDDKKVRNAVRDVVTRAINEAPWWWDRLHAALS